MPSRQGRLARTVAFISAVVVLRVAGAVLLGWATGLASLTAWRPGGIPMAPSTAVLALCLATALLTSSTRWSVGLSATAGVAAVILATQRILGVYSSIEHLGFSIQGSIGTAPIGFISPITASTFVIAAAGIAFLATSDRARLFRRASAIFGVLLLLASYPSPIVTSCQSLIGAGGPA